MVIKKLELVSKFEIAITNDGTSDDTGKILNHFFKDYLDIYSVHYKNNEGSAAINDTFLAFITSNNIHCPMQ